jgi:hypothetical protein
VRFGLRLPVFPLASSMTVSPASSAAGRQPECEPTPSTRRDLKRLGEFEDLQGIRLRSTEVALLDNLLKQRPDDVFLHLSYQRFTEPPTAAERSGITERYKKLADSHPGSAEYAYLYAAALVDANTPEAISLLKRILSDGSNYPLAHLELAEIY